MLDGPLERSHRKPDILLTITPIEVIPPDLEILPGIEIVCHHFHEAPLLGRRQCRLQCGGDRFDYLGLYGKEIFGRQFADQWLVPEDLLRLRIHQSHVDLHLVPRPLYTGCQDGIGPQLRADLGDAFARARVFPHRSPRYHPEPSHLGQFPDHIVVDAAGERIVHRVTAHVLEWQRRDDEPIRGAPFRSALEQTHHQRDDSKEPDGSRGDPTDQPGRKPTRCLQLER